MLLNKLRPILEVMRGKIHSKRLHRGVKDHINHAYDKITSYIYIGANLCCGLHFQKLKRLGFAADLDLEAERIERLSPGFKDFLRLPVKDDYAPTQKQLQQGADFINRFVKAKKKIYVHCKKGHGRSPTMVAAYFISKGKGVSEAVKYIKARRPEMHLEKVQVEALKQWSKRFKN